MKFGNVIELVSTISPVELEDSDFLLKTYFVKYPLSMLFCLYTYVVFVLGYTIFVLGIVSDCESSLIRISKKLHSKRTIPRRVQNLLGMCVDDFSDIAKFGFWRLYAIFYSLSSSSKGSNYCSRITNKKSLV